jgi:hypothetical protein
MRLAPAGSWERFWQNTFLVWAATYSWWHMFSVFVTVPFMFAAAF